MDNKIDIYLENKKLDIDSVDLAITYSYSDLMNPLNITCDYSKTITIKGNQTNNEIFGQIWRLDRSILTSDTINSGVYFNASKRADCRIYINGELFKSGYLKLNTVNNNKGIITYEVTFYSVLCDVLHSLQEKLLVDLNYPNNLRHIINRNTVNSFWNGTHELNPYMTYVMANNGLYDNFENGQIISYSNGAYVITDIDNGIELDECAKGEYRSYFQRPALTVKGTIDQIVADFNASNSTHIILDGNFFSAINPYYNNSVVTTSQYDLVTNSKVYNNSNSGSVLSATITENSNTDLDIIWPSDDNGIFNGTSYIDLREVENISTLNVEFEISAVFKLTVPAALLTNISVGNVIYLTNTKEALKITPNIYSYNDEFVQTMLGYSVNDTNISVKAFKVIEINGTTVTVQVYFPNIYTNYNPADVINGGLNPSIGSANSQYLKWMPIHYTTGITQLNTERYYLSLNIADIANENNYTWWINGITTTGTINIQSMDISLRNINDYYPLYGINYTDPFTGNTASIITTSDIRSNSVITKTNIINDEITQGDFLIDYAKIFGLIFETDEYDNIIIKDRNKFFEGYQILDWENKIDYSQIIKQSPITFDSKYVKFSYLDGDTYYENHYKNKFGIEYASLKLNTGLEFNNDIEDLYKDPLFNTTVISRENTKMFINNTFVFAKDEKILPALFKLEDNKRNISDTKYNLLFNNGLKNLNNPIVLSDDISEMFSESDNGCWLNTNDERIMAEAGLRLNSYPQFSTLYNGQFSWDIQYPRENYADLTTSSYPEYASIYNNFWRSYFNEIYNVDNKIVRCFIKLDPNDMCRFSFRNFIKAFGCIWHVNKIENYNPLSNKPVEVELFKVLDINAYTNSQKTFKPGYTISYQLYEVYSTNTSTIIEEGSSYVTGLRLYDNTDILGQCTVTMGGVDITSQVFNSDDYIINIPEVTGDITILAASRNYITENTNVE